MARLEVSAAGLALRMSLWEKAGACHGDLQVPWSAVASVRNVSDLWSQVRGIRAPGTGIPDVIMLGTTRGRGWKDFCAVYRHRPGVIVTLAAGPFARWLVTGPACNLPEGRVLAAELSG